MSSLVLDFFHNDGNIPPQYALRLRATNNGIVDLAGGTLVNENVDYTSIPSLYGGGGGITF